MQNPKSGKEYHELNLGHSVKNHGKVVQVLNYCSRLWLGDSPVTPEISKDSLDIRNLKVNINLKVSRIET